jgi:hypothetical protein
MAIRIGYNGQVSSGLVFAFDTADFFNSYRGEPTVNTIPSPQVNSYPTFGNGWASYNTNKYCGNNGCAVYWDIPSIASVSSNIITTNGSHGIYSFDVIRPESTGGGVTAGTDYFAKKISDTQFSLHAYNGSQGGDQGYINPATGGHKVHDSFWLDQRVSVSASGFPTKWWGAPHLPNSGLVKEIIVGGFDVYPSQKTDCMRLHAHRPESADGMSYGPDAVVVPGQVHTYSFWTRALNQQTANGGGYMSNYNYGSVSPTSWGHSYTHGPLGVWTRQSFQFTPINENVISYFWPGALDKYDLANIQVERKSYPTPFVAGSRSTTTALLDATGNKTIDLTNASYNSSGNISLDGSGDYIKVQDGASFFRNEWTWDMVVKFTANTGTYAGLVWGEGDVGGGSGYQYLLSIVNNSYFHYRINNSSSGWANTDVSGFPISIGNWAHITWQFNNGTTKIYINGSLFHTDTSRGSYSGGTNSPLIIGARNDGWGSSAMEIGSFKFYNRYISADEVSQNFKSYKKRFNL